VKLVEINWNPTDRQLRQFGAISALALPAMGRLWGGSAAFVVGLATVGASMFVCGWFRPQSLKPLFLGMTIVAIPIGMVFGELTMLAIYFVVFLPIGLAFRITGRDSLQLKRDRIATTYWQSKKQPAGVASYFRQS
jgi:hypothetical protein